MTQNHQLRAFRIIRELHPEFWMFDSEGRAHSDRAGTWYEWPMMGPSAILFDDDGYVVFYGWFDLIDTLNRHGVEVNLSDLPDKLNIRLGISSLSRYVRCNHSHWDEVHGEA